jgi:hypothetical protein
VVVTHHPAVAAPATTAAGQPGGSAPRRLSPGEPAAAPVGAKAPGAPAAAAAAGGAAAGAGAADAGGSPRPAVRMPKRGRRVSALTAHHRVGSEAPSGDGDGKLELPC